MARGGGDSVSLTSEVVADTKCRQELVEVMLKPWGGMTGGTWYKWGAGGARGSWGAAGTHQQGGEERRGAPHGGRG